MRLASRGWSASDHGVDAPDVWWRTVAFPRLVAAIRAEDLLDEHIDILDSHYHRFGVPLVGRTRAVFRTGDGYVIKVAHTWEGLAANALEAAVSQAVDPVVPMAPTELLKDGSVRAEEVTVLTVWDYRTVPTWIRSVDCAQVGYLADGRLVAYDL
ncbi:hypothetical protein AB0C34_17470 [Nocardia sp. NPDC049220]|uniref:hypothetical protein n=1 Tax=Nocardia sp. NPDC049220 TaxID=3155273 RepID=UPI0033E8C47B